MEGAHFEKQILGRIKVLAMTLCLRPRDDYTSGRCGIHWNSGGAADIVGEMPTSRTLILDLVICLAGTAGLCQSSHPSLDPDVASRQARRTRPNFSLEIRALQNEVQPGSKILVDVTIKNTLDEEIAMTSFHELGLRELIILDSEGKPALTKLGQDIASGKEFLVGGHSKLFFVQPGKPEKEIITVRSDLYDLNRAGKYTLQVQRLDSVTKTWVKSNVITVSVTLTPNGGS